ncbi:unnamed protein product [Aphanomyces euteiches]|uniref:Poly [ADP-ribose] polymerase n=1 Tax=Aphanomyces euteiches TaxID=100861 RepID=A0A6G0WAE3_9STRA|nr:hypothetical protein Ae201684_016992 [Aphanomyces euteiches]KAH9073627.1 hypothetical protein Ae201684P_003131 [Aphanomyces euteiches]KAH9158045.1 hypothetical protein AeRB84_000180 [Aphanomyces euteiches]
MTKSVKKRRRSLARALPDDSTHDADSSNTKRTKNSPPKSRFQCVAPVDFAFSAVSPAWVLQDDEDSDVIYDAHLFQVNLESGMNNALVLQVIASDEGCFVWQREYDRRGRREISTSCSEAMTAVDAVDEFMDVFEEKTGVAWEDRSAMSVDPPTGFTYVPMDYPSSSSCGASSTPPKKLQEQVRSLMALVFHDEDEYTSDAAALTPLQLPYAAMAFDKAHFILDQIAAMLGAKSRVRRLKLRQASEAFYSAIPHDFGQPMLDCVIDSMEKIDNCRETLHELRVSCNGRPLLSLDPLHQKYTSLECHLELVATDSLEFNLVTQYLNNSKAHVQYEMKIEHVFRVAKEMEVDKFKPFESFDNRMLLWHGSSLSNWSGILKDGLRIAPPNVTSNGHSFGKGIYFSDSVSRSAPYCRATLDKSKGILLLSEVALGKSNACTATNSRAMNEVDFVEFHSVVGLGSFTPTPGQNHVLPDGATIPLGALKRQSLENKRTHHLHLGSGLEYNEYVIYNPAQTRMRYLVVAEFCFDT